MLVFFQSNFLPAGLGAGNLVSSLVRRQNPKDRIKNLSSVSTLFEGRADSYAKSDWTSSQGAVGLS